jgi:hypothetical protein
MIMLDDKELGKIPKTIECEFCSHGKNSDAVFVTESDIIIDGEGHALLCKRVLYQCCDCKHVFVKTYAIFMNGDVRLLER